jgi:hypothetical protein
MNPPFVWCMLITNVSDILASGSSSWSDYPMLNTCHCSIQYISQYPTESETNKGRVVIFWPDESISFPRKTIHHAVNYKFCILLNIKLGPTNGPTFYGNIRQPFSRKESRLETVEHNCVSVHCMLHPPLAWADMVSKSKRTTPTEKVDMRGVSWKCTQVHSVSLILQTEVTIIQPFPGTIRTSLISKWFFLGWPNIFNMRKHCSCCVIVQTW